VETLEQYLTEYTRAYNPSQNTIRNKRSALRRLLSWVEEKGLDWEDLDGDDVIDYLESTGAGSETQKLTKSHIKQFYDWALSKKLVYSNPGNVLYRPKKSAPRALVKDLSDDEVRQLLNTLPSLPSDSDKFILLYSLARPVRLDELVKLRVRDVNLKTGTVMLERTKNGSSRWHLIPDRCTPIVGRLVQGKGGDDFLLGISLRVAFMRVQEMYRLAGVEARGRAAHAFRHTVIRRLIHRKGIPVHTVAEMAGNSPETIRRVYIGETPQDRYRQAMGKAEDF
jgi:site-specific recombinase XerD